MQVLQHVDAYIMALMLRSYACCNKSQAASVTTARLPGTTCLIQRQAVSSCRAFVGSPVTVRQQKCRRSGPELLQARAGLLSFFWPTKQSTNKSQAAELVTKILHIASQTNSGAIASQEQCKEIRQLAEQLQQAGGEKDPVYSELTWGNYEVTYSSYPQAAGGPVLRSPLGQLIFANQQLRQTLAPPETLINSVSFKTLRLFPGNAKQPATIQTLTGTTYKITVQAARIFGVKLGPERAERKFEVLYLDERVRIVQFLPSDSQQRSEPVLFVLRRLDYVTQEHVEGDMNNIFSTLGDKVRGLTRPSTSKAGLATQAERKFSQQNSASR